MADPLVSVSIPSYNHAPFLPAAIESVLGQTYPRVELVVVEDGSADGSLEVARRYEVAHPGRVRVVTHAEGHLGVNATANRGIREARGVYWGGLPSDDVLCPDKVERQVALLEADPALVFAYGQTRLIDERGRPLPGESPLGEDLSTHPRPLERLLQVNCVPGVTALVRLEALHRFAPELHRELVYSDWDLWIRLAAHGRVGFVPRTVTRSRVHSSNLSWDASAVVHQERNLAVLEAIRASAPRIGGAFSEGRTRALVDLELVFLHHSWSRRDAAARSLAAALDSDPALRSDPGRLVRWIDAHVDVGTPTWSATVHAAVSAWVNGARHEPPTGVDLDEDFTIFAYARLPAELRSGVAQYVAGFQLARGATAAEYSGDIRLGRRLALRSLRVTRAPLSDRGFRRLLLRLCLGRRPSALVRRAAARGRASR